MKVVRKAVRLKRQPGLQPAQAGPIVQPVGPFGMGAPQGAGGGLMSPAGGSMRRPSPKPTHTVTYKPGMQDEPAVQKARAKLRAGRGPRQTDFATNGSKRRGGWA